MRAISPTACSLKEAFSLGVSRHIDCANSASRKKRKRKYRQGKFVSNWTKMGRTSSEKVVLRVVGHCAGIPKNNSGQFGTKWTTMKRTPYEWIVFDRFLVAENWQPGPVCHQMDKYRGRTPYENTVSDGFWDTRAGLAPNEPNWDEHLTIGRFRGNPRKCPIKGRKITPWTPQPSERSA